MEAKEIKKGISPLVERNKTLDNQTTEPKALLLEGTDALAARIAVEHTYGKGLNPEVYEDVVKALSGLLDYSEESLEAWANGTTLITCTFVPYHFKQALEALKKARI